MIEGKYDIVFRGQTVKSLDISEVKSNLIGLFKSTPAAIDKLFSGAEVPIRKGLSYAEAMKYQSALKNAGALALIKEVEQVKAKQARATFNVEENQDEQSDVKVSAIDTTKGNQEPATNATGGSLSIAEPGARLLPDKVYEQREVDTSTLTLAKAGEKILESYPKEKPLNPDIDHLSLVN